MVETVIARAQARSNLNTSPWRLLRRFTPRNDMVSEPGKKTGNPYKCYQFDRDLVLRALFLLFRQGFEDLLRGHGEFVKVDSYGVIDGVYDRGRR